MGLARHEALASIRLSLGFASTDADVDRALEVIPDSVERLRAVPAAS
jgi:cysteine sulfinate desulfinase/cysteine desulfurase-like protein